MNTIERAKELAQERNLTLFKLAKLSGISPALFTNCERRGGQLTVDTIERVCVGLGISLSEFFAVKQVQMDS